MVRICSNWISAFIEWIFSAFENAYTFLFSMAVTTIGYFSPIKNIVHLMLLFFLFDVIFGYWAAKKIRNEKFQVKIIWEYTMPRVLISIVIILGTYLWDNVFVQEYISSYRLIGWFICGILLYSISKNGLLITNWKIFGNIGDIIKNGLESKTGQKINE